MRRRNSLIAGLLALGALFAAGAADPPPIRFREIAKEAGIAFVLENSPTERKHLIETMPGGIAVFDYDRDGRPDIYFTSGAEIPSLEKSAAKYWNRLYHNEGGMKFRDVTAEAGVSGGGYSMGAAAADFDNDGRTDLFVAGVNRNILYRNLGDGKFLAVDDICSHAEASLSEGDVDVDDLTIECPRHGSVFDLETGRPRSLPATVPIAIFPVKVEGDRLLIELED